MILLDTDLIIYANSPNYPELRASLGRVEYSASVMSKLEALGYHKIDKTERTQLEIFFDSIPLLAITDDVIAQAVTIRQVRNIKVADAIIAATALVHELELWTHNTADFKLIRGLKLKDPLKT